MDAANKQEEIWPASRAPQASRWSACTAGSKCKQYRHSTSTVRYTPAHTPSVLLGVFVFTAAVAAGPCPAPIPLLRLILLLFPAVLANIVRLHHREPAGYRSFIALLAVR